ncbi:MAG: sulfotransferase, partial [Luteimonas sp.]
ALINVGETVAARDCLEFARFVRAPSPSSLMMLAHVHQTLDQHANALAIMNRAFAAGVDNADFRYFRSVQFQFNGLLDDAEDDLEACLRVKPTYGRAALARSRLRQQSAERNHIDFIRAQIARVAQGSEDHAALEFAHYKELEDVGDNAQAWQALVRANALMHAQRPDASADEAALDARLMATCSAEFLHAGGADEAHAQQSGPMPIFIVGMPRSGSTLLDRMLGAHSAVVSAGELFDFARQLQWSADHACVTLLDDDVLSRAPALDYAQLGARYLAQTQWRAQGRAFFIDKLPPNAQLAGFIHRALPHARIVQVVRDPMDTCFSNYKALFGSAYRYSYDLDTLAAHYLRHRRLMAHWHEAMPDKILDVPYAALVRDPETVMRQVLGFCGLEFEPACVDTASNAAPVATLSNVQVREPVHTRSIGEWRRYEKELAPLQAALQAFD